MQDFELVVQTILDEVSWLERYAVTGRPLNSDYLQALEMCVKQLAELIKETEQTAAGSWETNNEPVPPWLQPTQNNEEQDPQQEIGSSLQMD